MCRQSEEGVDLQSGSQRHRHFIGFFSVPVQHQHKAILSVLPWLDPSIAKLNLNSQPKDDPYVVSLDHKSGQIHMNGLITYYLYTLSYELYILHVETK